MDCINEMNINKELEKLGNNLSRAQQKMKITKNRATKKKLRDLINSIKLDLACELINCDEDEKGLALYGSVSGKHYEERRLDGIGRAFTKMGLYDEARVVLEKGLSKFPESYTLLTELGVLHGVLENHVESLRYFEKALQFAPKGYPGYLFNKGLALFKLGSYDDALSIIENLVEEYPEEPKCLALRGYYALEMGDPQDALQHYQKGMLLLENSATVDTSIEVLTGLYFSYMELGMKKEALEIAVEGVRRFPHTFLFTILVT